MAIVRVDSQHLQHHTKPAAPPGAPPENPNIFNELEMGLQIPERGGATLDPSKSAEWAQRRQTIRQSLSQDSGGASADQLNSGESAGRTGSFGRAAKAFGAKVSSALGLKKVSSGVRRMSAAAARRGSEVRGTIVQLAAPPVPLSPHALNVCREMRETEAAYITDLQTVLEVYVRPAIERRVMTLEDTQAIFANLEELSRCASVLLELMDREGDRAAVIAHAFIQVTPFFKLYAFYCRNYERALTTLATCRKSIPGFNEFMQTQSMLPQCRGLSLESYLIKPVQRLTKYPLFWKDLLKSVPHAHPDRLSLEKADELVRTVSMAVNQTLSDEVSRLKTVQVLKELGSEWMELIAPHRKLVVEFSGTMHVGHKSWPASGYVLSDMLIICKHQTGLLGDRRTPWLLSELTDVLVNEEVGEVTDLAQVSLAIDEDSVVSTAVSSGVPQPAGVPRSRLLNLRICEGDGKAPDEEYWLELEDESLAYQLGERIPALSNEALHQLLTQSNQRSSATGELGAKLRDARLRKIHKAGGVHPRYSSAAPRPSRAERRSAAVRESGVRCSGVRCSESCHSGTDRGSSDRATSERTEQSESDRSTTGGSRVITTFTS